MCVTFPAPFRCVSLLWSREEHRALLGVGAQGSSRPIAGPMTTSEQDPGHPASQPSLGPKPVSREVQAILCSSHYVYLIYFLITHLGQ